MKENYLTSTLAPTASNFSFIWSASSLETPSFNVLGALSTTSLASFNRNPVTSLSAFITHTFV